MTSIAHKGHILGGGSYLDSTGQHFVLAVVDLDAAAPAAQLIEVSFLVHALSVDPNQATRIACFEKHGPGACIIDLASRSVVQPIRTAANRQFYGHGSFSADGGLLYATESYLDDALRGALIIRDAHTLRELGQLPSYGAAPHDCQLIDDGRVMIVTNGGGPLRGGSLPNVAYIELSTHKLLDKVELPERRFNAGHLAWTPKGDLAVVSAPREGLPDQRRKLGAVSLKPAGKPITTMRKPKAVVQRMKGETLSVAIYEPARQVVATHPLGDMVSMWQLDSGKLLRKYDQFEGPCGVCLTLDQSHYVISHVMDGLAGLSLVSTQSGEQAPDLSVCHTMTSGSHIFAHALTSVSAA